MNLVATGQNVNYNTSWVDRPELNVKTGPEYLGDYNAAEAELSLRQAQRDNWLNGGNTPSLEAQILFADDQQDYQNLYIDLMNASPYVETQLLLDVIAIEDYPEQNAPQALLRPANLPMQFSLSPNPAGESIRLTWSKEEVYPLQEMSLMVLDMQGRMLLQQELSDITLEIAVLDLNRFINGNYVLEVRQGEKVLYNEKFIVKK